jgi:hypothetical protein
VSGIEEKSFLVPQQKKIGFELRVSGRFRKEMASELSTTESFLPAPFSSSFPDSTPSQDDLPSLTKYWL